jgi:aspartate aminotransferase-like enzyme
MSILPNKDPEGLLEFSVVFNDRSLNHMSERFQGVMRDISSTLKRVYAADAVIVMPGGGTFGMEAIARQFASDQRCLVIRNGWFSYRWSQIFEMGRIPAHETVLKAARLEEASEAPFAPPKIDDVLRAIRQEKPQLVFAAHVETAAGIMLPLAYIQAVSAAAHEVGALFVLDCIASGTEWIDMKAAGVDILISAPQKGWSASPCSALIMLSAKARQRLDQSKSSSFAADLSKWMQIMQAYENGGHAYHATMPTDALVRFHQAMKDCEAFGFDKAAAAQRELGAKVRRLLTDHGYRSVAAPGFEAPSVVVSYTRDDAIHKGSAFAKLGLQTAAGVPLMCDEPQDFKTFRIGLFGLDKLNNVDKTVGRLKAALYQL